LALVIAVQAVVCSNAFANDNNNDAPDYIDRIQIIGHSDKLRTEAGSATLIGEAELEKFKFDDINRILYNVPGVNIREEDGFGLRPNIGFRGSTPERSKKITVMEDGILIGPAPYSAPAAYYFPMMSKMTALEVFKGPAATKYGPNTVAGALNMTTRMVPDFEEGMVDVAAGTDGYAKAHAYYGNTIDNFGFIIEGVHMESDGFKELDGGGDTGFDKNDLMVKLRYNLTGKSFNQVFEFKWAYADEKSNETYLGLTDQDFKANPVRRYAASQLDKMDWQHNQIQLSHFIQADKFDITTRIYRNDFERSWFKINGFKPGIITRDLQQILAGVDDETNALFYQVLTGQRDSQKEYEKIILGDNDREYYSQGIQSEIFWQQDFAGLTHEFNAGLRVHQDRIERNHTEDAFLMQSSRLVSDGSETLATTTNAEETDAIAVFLRDTISWHSLDVTLGLRGEFLDTRYENRKAENSDDWLEKESSIWLPSFSLFYSLSESAGILFGVHEGFVPTSPQESPEIDIENSVNYELGGRFNNGTSKFEAILFFNDISNLKESCSFSAASACAQSLDAEFNGGEVDVFGLEFSASHTFKLNPSFDMPISMVYTYVESEFKSDFASDFPMWGQITAGDQLPYLPENQLTLNLGLVSDFWEVNLIARYVDSMLEASGDGVILTGETTSDYTIVDISANYDLGDAGTIYLKVDNIFEQQEIISRRPYGARPSKPQMAFVGYRYRF